MIIAVSDVHLGHYCSDKRQFTKFLDEIVGSKKVEHFVLAGDIIDMWRRDPLKVVLENIDVFERLASLQNGSRQVHFLAGNHDYHMIELKQDLWDQFNLDVSMDISLPCKGQYYHFFHGHQLEFADNLEIYQEFASILCMGDDRVGASADSLWGLYTMGTSVLGLSKAYADFKRALTPPGERLSDDDVHSIEGKALNVREEFRDQMGDTFLVYGHTHRPFVDEENRLANTGSWVDDPLLPMYKKNTYIQIEDFKPPELKEYP